MMRFLTSFRKLMVLEKLLENLLLKFLMVEKCVMKIIKFLNEVMRSCSR